MLLNGCALMAPQFTAMQAQPPAATPTRVELSDVPFFAQDAYQCGPAALATVMVHRGLSITPEALVPHVYLPARQGSLQVEMLAAPRASGLITMVLAPRLDAVLREVRAGNPVVVLQDLGVWPLPYWHYAVVIGFDMEQGTAVLRSGEKQRVVLPMVLFEYSWRPGGHWAMVAMRPDQVPATATESQWLAAIHAAERAALSRPQLGGDAPDAMVRVAYAAALQRWPMSAGAAIALANVDYRAGRLAEAEAIMQAAVAHHPTSGLVLNNLANLVFERGRPAEALRLAERAVAHVGPFHVQAKATHERILAKMTALEAAPTPAR